MDAGHRVLTWNETGVVILLSFSRKRSRKYGHTHALTRQKNMKTLNKSTRNWARRGM